MVCGHMRIIVRHLLPNVVATIIILATIGLGAVILAESALSFLGFGVPPPYPSWGGMLSGSGRTYMLRAPWMAVWPGVAISLAVFGFNMLGDALRDVLDPRLALTPLTTTDEGRRPILRRRRHRLRGRRGELQSRRCGWRIRHRAR